MDHVGSRRTAEIIKIALDRIERVTFLDAVRCHCHQTISPTQMHFSSSVKPQGRV